MQEHAKEFDIDILNWENENIEDVDRKEELKK